MAFMGTVHIETQTVVLQLEPIVHGNDVGIAFILQGDTDDLCILKDLPDTNGIGDLPV